MSGGLQAIAAAFACAAVVVAAEPVLIPVLRRAAVMDVPGSRSSHEIPTPRGGGVPIAAGLLAAALLTGGVTSIAFGVTVAAFGLLGLSEDVLVLPAWFRFAAQLTWAFLIGLVLVSSIPIALPDLVGLALIAALWITAFVNAFNFMDGVNGISGAHTLVGGLTFVMIGWWGREAFLLCAGAAVAAGGLAFLPWNALRARVFLGDSGSYALGAALAVLAGYAVAHRVPPEAALGPLALYVADTGWTLQRRIRSGERWFEAHRTHVYQRWCDAGWSHQRVTAVTSATSALLSLLGSVSLFAGPGARAAADLAALAVLAGYLCSPGLLLRRADRMATRITMPLTGG
jgi:UDP-N-acetylmuramyl pentapeptide phosphotransferase/UDP-N-acetylglucosamine-1-phosphate transferase